MQRCSLHSRPDPACRPFLTCRPFLIYQPISKSECVTMLTLEGCLARRSHLWNALPAELEWVLIADPRHVQYLANFLVQPLSFSGGERAWLLLERSGKATLLGDNFSLRSRTAEPFYQ